MRTSDEIIQEQLAAIPDTESLVGIFVSQDGNIATVDQGNSRLEVKAATQVPCRPGDAVRLERRHGQLVVIGPTTTPAVLGKVTVAGNPATIEYPPGSGVTAVLPVAAGVSVGVNDTVFLDWASGGLVLANVASPVVPETPSAPGGGGNGGGRILQTFDAIDSGSYESGPGWRTNEVWSSASNVGAWFYGSKIRDTIPDNAVILGASIYLPTPKKLLGARPFGRHSSDSRPAGAVTITDTSTIGTTGLVSIPTSLIDHLKQNPGGLGFALGGWNIWPGTQQDGRSGQLMVEYAF